MVAIFGNDGLAWGIGIVVGAVFAALVLVAIGFAFRKYICPREDPDATAEGTSTQPAEQHISSRLEVESTGDQDRARPHIGSFAVATDDDSADHSDAELDEHGNRKRFERPQDGVRRVVVQKKAVDNAARRWRY